MHARWVSKQGKVDVDRTLLDHERGCCSPSHAWLVGFVAWCSWVQQWFSLSFILTWTPKAKSRLHHQGKGGAKKMLKTKQARVPFINLRIVYLMHTLSNITHCWRNADLMFSLSGVMASIRKKKIGSEKSAPQCLFDRGGVKGHLSNARLNGPIFKKGLPLTSRIFQTP